MDHFLNASIKLYVWCDQTTDHMVIHAKHKRVKYEYQIINEFQIFGDKYAFQSISTVDNWEAREKHSYENRVFIYVSHLNFFMTFTMA